MLRGDDPADGEAGTDVPWPLPLVKVVSVKLEVVPDTGGGVADFRRGTKATERRGRGISTPATAHEGEYAYHHVVL